MYMRAVAAGVLIAAIGGGCMMISDLKNQVAGLTEVSAKCSAENVRLKALIDAQNAQVEKLKAESEEQLASARAEAIAAGERASTAKVKATIIYRTKPASSTSCASILDLVNSQE